MSFKKKPEDEVAGDDSGERNELRYSVNMETRAQEQLRLIAEAFQSGDEPLKESAVLLLLSFIPKESRERIRARVDEYTTTISEWKPVKSGGWRLSEDPYNPAYGNEPESHEYDPLRKTRRWEIVVDKNGSEDIREIHETGGLHQLSPLRVTYETTSLHKLVELMVDELQDVNAAWRNVRKSRVQRRVPKSTKPTPYHKDDSLKDESQPKNA